MPKLRSKRKRQESVLLPDGSALFHAGIIADADFTGTFMQHDVLARMGYKAGDYVQIELEDRGTAITRKIACSDCAGYSKLLGNYIYMDPQSAFFLEAETSVIVRVRPAQCTFDMP
jgi:hypothetical protein